MVLCLVKILNYTTLLQNQFLLDIFRYSKNLNLENLSF